MPIFSLGKQDLGHWESQTALGIELRSGPKIGWEMGCGQNLVFTTLLYPFKTLFIGKHNLYLRYVFYSVNVLFCLQTHLVMDVARHQSKGYGFVSFPCRRSAELAMIW